MVGRSALLDWSDSATLIEKIFPAVRCYLGPQDKHSEASAIGR
jgi:hypothetical protein